MHLKNPFNLMVHKKCSEDWINTGSFVPYLDDYFPISYLFKRFCFAVTHVFLSRPYNGQVPKCNKVSAGKGNVRIFTSCLFDC